MHIAPINFTGKAEINNYAKQYGPLTKQEQKVKDMAEKFYDIEMDITSDGFYLEKDDKEFSQELVETLKATKTTSPFAYKVAVDLVQAPANMALLYGAKNFADAALAIAKDNPSITKEMILDDFDSLNKI